eukprot:scaffold14990_cov80-Phaeocystis_antarctica.AAC.2
MRVQAVQTKCADWAYRAPHLEVVEPLDEELGVLLSALLLRELLLEPHALVLRRQVGRVALDVGREVLLRRPDESLAHLDRQLPH